nr:MAG TPA: hypothetical protein [Caudoviricetes sp.]
MPLKTHISRINAVKRSIKQPSCAASPKNNVLHRKIYAISLANNKNLVYNIGMIYLSYVCAAESISRPLCSGSSKFRLYKQYLNILTIKRHPLYPYQGGQ